MSPVEMQKKRYIIMKNADVMLLLDAQNGIVQIMHIRNADKYGCAANIPNIPDTAELLSEDFFSEIWVGSFILFSFDDLFSLYFTIIKEK